MNRQAALPATVIVGAPSPADQATVGRWRRIIVAAAIGLAVILGAGAAYWLSRPAAPPPLTDKVENLIRFMMSPAAGKLSFERQMAYLQKIDARRDKIAEAYQTRKITHAEYIRGRSLAYFGKHLKRMERVFSLQGAEREAYLRQIAPDKHRPPGRNPDPDDTPEEIENLIRDKIFLKTYPQTWPADVRARWEEYHKLVEDMEQRMRKEYKAMHKAQEASKKVAPSTANPSTAPAGGAGGQPGR